MNEIKDNEKDFNPEVQPSNEREPEAREPTVLDYFKSLLTPWKGKPIPFPTADGQPEKLLIEAEDSQAPLAEAQASRASFPWRTGVALLLVLFAQSAFAPPGRSMTAGIVLLLGAVMFVIWGMFKSELLVTPYPESQKVIDKLKVRPLSLVIGGFLAGLSFMSSLIDLSFVINFSFLKILPFFNQPYYGISIEIQRSQFNWLNLSLLILSLAFLLHAFWRGKPTPLRNISQAVRKISDPGLGERFPIWSLLVLAAVGMVLFFRIYQIDMVPPEMVSDHAEKYLDVDDILSGNTRIFFPRNGGREALQFYLLAALVRYFGAAPNHLTLKISTVLVGLLALPYVYLLGKEIGNRRVALFAFTFAGIAYWTNVVGRAGMRLPFYMFFSVAILYHLLRAIRHADRNHFLLAGIFLGLGFYGYSADRLLPLVVIAGIGLYLIHRQSRGFRVQTIWQTILLALMALVVFLPLLSYILYDPTGFSGRMLSRLSGTEQALQGPAALIFLDNFWRALRMFSVSAGVVWGVSIPNYPALGVVTGGLFYLGLAMLLVRYIRKLHWLDLFLILSIPLLMLPSILALAFPSENPNLYRTGGAMVPVFILVGIAADSLMSSLEQAVKRPWGTRLAWGLVVLLLGWAAIQEYDLVFDKYYQNYRQSAWNYSEMGGVIKSFSESSGSPETAWVMGYPHWADTRLVAIEAGYPERDYAMFIDGLESTTQDPQPKLFLVHLDDNEAIRALKKVYPLGWVQTYESSVENRDFLMYFTPPAE